MTVRRHCTVKVVPGKMGEFLELQKKYDIEVKRLGLPPHQRYSCLNGESMHTFVYATEWDSFAAMEKSFEKLYADLKARQVCGEIADVTESHEVEFYMPCPEEDLPKFPGVFSPSASRHLKMP